jgi:hypothetical protein
MAEDYDKSKPINLFYPVEKPRNLFNPDPRDDYNKSKPKNILNPEATKDFRDYSLSPEPRKQDRDNDGWMDYLRAFEDHK